MTADELWNKYKHNVAGFSAIGPEAFKAALAERDAYVKKECARVCREQPDNFDFPDQREVCAEAIEKLEIK